MNIFKCYQTRYSSLSLLRGFLLCFLLLGYEQAQARDIKISVQKIISDTDHLNYVVRAKIYPNDPNHLYLTSRGSHETGNNARLSIYDISQPISPKLIYFWKANDSQEALKPIDVPVTYGLSTNLAQLRGIPYLENVLEGQDRVNDTLAVLSIYTGKLHLFDVTHPENPVKKSSLDLDAGSAIIPYMQALHVKIYTTNGSHYALITSPQTHSVIAVNIDNPEQPQKVATLPLDFNVIPGGEGLEGIYLHKDYAYCGAFHGNQFITVSLKELGNQHKLSVANTLKDDAYDQMVSLLDPREQYSTVLYSASWSSPGGIIAFDLSNPAAPKEISRIVSDKLSKANRIKLWHNFALIPQEITPGSIAVVDVTDPNKMNLVKTMSPIEAEGKTINAPYAMAINGDYAYVFGSDGANMAILHLSEQ